MSRRNLHGQRGFTIIELVVVVVIIGILVTLAISTYISSVGRIRLRTDARAVIQSLQMARIKAQATCRLSCLPVPHNRSSAPTSMRSV